MQVVGSCKTEASQKPIPLDARLGDALRAWRRHTKYAAQDDWIFASQAVHGQWPYWGQPIMRNVIQPKALEPGINKRFGWHSFVTYSTLLRANRTDIKVQQELLRHASSRVTMDTYTQAITVQKRRAQSTIVRRIRP
jgi:integrase